MDVAGFLALHPPFDTLSKERLADVAANVRIQFFPAGTVILQEGGDPARWFSVIRKGAVELIEGNVAVDLLMEGESFGQLSMLSGLGPTATLRAHEDTICYLLGRETAVKVLGTRGGLAYASSMARRQIIRAEQTLIADRADPSAVPVGSLIQRRPVTCGATTTVREAATLMAGERISSLLVPCDEGWGILTDRDLRSRVLAEGRSADTPVGEVMTFPAVSVPPETMAAEVRAMMFERDVHHFPVVEADGRLLGVVTDTDLMRLERYSPVALKSAIARAPDVDATVAAGRDMPRVVFALVDAHADAVDVGHVVGVTVDSLTTRLLELVMEELGPAPCSWAWLALGSAARHEQALHSDQDHALAYDPRDLDPAEVDPYFAEVAKRVTDALERVGIPRCNGGAMAENPQMRRTLDGWVEAFHTWMDDPGLEGSIFTSIVFDYRRVSGPLDVETALDAVIRSAQEHPIFLRHLARRALDDHPPTGFFRDLVVEARGEHAGTLDVKHRGITLVTNLARASAISAGIAENRTVARLRAAEGVGRIDRETRDGLEEAFRILWQVRLEHQVRMARAGDAPDDFVDPRTLGPLSRRGLKEAFRMITRAQRTLAADLGIRSR